MFLPKRIIFLGENENIFKAYGDSRRITEKGRIEVSFSMFQITPSKWLHTLPI